MFRAFATIVMIAFVAFSVSIGVTLLHKTMQDRKIERTRR